MVRSKILPQIISNFKDSKRLLAQLMARENLVVQVVDGLSTASMDVVRRVLSIPNWTTLTQPQFDHLIGHEVGHALFTETSFIDTLKKEKKPGLKSYFNVVEDARIERKMKNVYPGLTSDFYQSYKTFTENGPLFKVVRGTHIVRPNGEEYEVATAKLIDRINLFFKIGAFVNVPFDASEQVWLQRIQKCPDMETALQIAKELWQWSKDNETESDPKSSEDGDGDGEGEPGDGDGDGEGDADGDGECTCEECEDDGTAKKTKKRCPKCKGKPKKQTPGSGADDSDPFSQTDKDLNDALKEIADKASEQNTMRHLLYPVMTEATVKGRIVGAKEWSDSVYTEMRRHTSMGMDIDKSLDVLEGVWNGRFMATAKAMAAEFDRRKTAKQYQRATVAKTGRLDLQRLHQFQFTDDLFKRSTMIPNGQSHGFVMIIDASGSMSGIFPDVIDQALLFAAFCYYAKIPCEIYMFHDSQGGKAPTGLLTLTLAHKGQLVGMINTVTDRGSFRLQMRACLAFKAKFQQEKEITSDKFYQAMQGLPYSGLGGTPLFTGIMLGEFATGRLKRAKRLDKMIFAVVSDGGDTDGVYFEDNTVTYNGTVTTRSRNLTECAGMVVRDERTRKNHVHIAGGNTPQMPNNAPLSMLLDVLGSRHDAQTAYFYLTGPGSSVGEGLRLHVRDGNGATMASDGEATRVIREQGQYVFPERTGVADLTMILPTAGLRLRDSGVPVDSVKPSRGQSVVDGYVDVLKDRQNSRKFINAVMPFIA